jgi:hypothetical protein
MNKNELRYVLKNQFVDVLQLAIEEDFLLKTLWNTVLSSKPACVGLYAAINHEVDLS